MTPISAPSAIGLTSWCPARQWAASGRGRGRPPMLPRRPGLRPVLGYDEPMVSDAASPTELELADWRRRVARLYADVRFLHVDDPVAAWQHWRSEREELYRNHPQSPVLPDLRP